MRNQLNEDALSWLLEPGSPGLRYLAMRELCDLPASDPGLLSARAAAHREGPIAEILAKMEPQGFWSKAGPGYGPKYFSSVWSIILLAQLGACAEEDERISIACNYLVDHALTSSGQFSVNGTPSGTIDCLQGNLCGALLELGYRDPRLDLAFEWMARTVTGENMGGVGDRKTPLRYYTYKCGPNFACTANGRAPCAWGAVKVLLALARLPLAARTPLIARAISAGVDFLFSIDPASAAYPSAATGKPSQSWWKFGFPVFYVTDILQLVEALVLLGYGNDPGLANALELIRSKQDQQGRWQLEYTYSGKTWVDFGPKHQPNQWVTLRSLRVLKAG
jgi:hypothetical protein